MASRRALVPVLLAAALSVGCGPLLEIGAIKKVVAVATFDPLPPDPSVGRIGGQEQPSFLEVGHPLATSITSTEHGSIDVAGLVGAARENDVIWVGVEPNNAQAYRFAARYLRALARAGLRAPVMVAAVPGDAPLRVPAAPSMRQQAWALSDSLPWEDYGADDPLIMPGLIEPVFRAAIEARMTMVGGGYSRAKMRALALAGEGAVSTREGAEIGLDYPWHRTRTRELAAAMGEEYEHCPATPQVSDAAVMMDRVESGGLASRVMRALPRTSVRPALIVIAELRHGRRDVGAPHTLNALALRSGRSVKQLTVGIQEASWERASIAQYREESRRHDVVWLTEPLYEENTPAPTRVCAL